MTEPFRMDHVQMDFMAGASFEFRVGYDVFSDGFNLWLVAVGPNKQVTHVADPVLMRPVTDRAVPNAPTMTLGPSLLDQLMASLTKQGVKAPEASKLEGLLDAQGKHLEDMRQLVFKVHSRRRAATP